MHRPSPLSTQALLDGLTSYGVTSKETLTTALGPTPEALSLNQLELALVARQVVTPERLLQLKGAITGLRTYDDMSIKVATALDPKVVRLTGSMVLDRKPLTVVMVEDTEYNLQALGGALGTTDFEVWITTAHHFDALYRQWYLTSEAGELPVVSSVLELLEEAQRRRASDIHLSVGQPPILRIDSTLVRLPKQPLTQEFFDEAGPLLTSPEDYARVEETHDIDAAYSFGESRFRVNIGADFHGPTIALRKIPTKVPALDEIGLPKAARDFCKLERGLVLVTGPTGSGKSTTLASMLAHISAIESRHIITLEDPIEFYIPSGLSVVHQRELGASFTSFPAGLRQALRQDPDVILVGELRDLETMKTALTAAETGHLVFATLHTFDATSTVGRLVSSFPPEEQAQARSQLAYILKGIVAQKLMPLASGRGRAAAFEIMISTPAIQNNLSKLDGHHQIHQTIETSQREGMQTMEMSLVDLVRRGLVREEEARFNAPDRDAFDRRLQMTQGH